MLPNFIQNPNDQKLFSPVPKWLKNMYSHATSLENKKGQSMLYCTCIIATMYVKSLRHVFIQNPDKSEGHKNIVTSHRTLTDEKATITSLFLKVYTIKHRLFNLSLFLNQSLFTIDKTTLSRNLLNSDTYKVNWIR